MLLTTMSRLLFVYPFARPRSLADPSGFLLLSPCLAYLLNPSCASCVPNTLSSKHQLNASKCRHFSFCFCSCLSLPSSSNACRHRLCVPKIRLLVSFRNLSVSFHSIYLFTFTSSTDARGTLSPALSPLWFRDFFASPVLVTNNEHPSPLVDIPTLPFFPSVLLLSRHTLSRNHCHT